MTALDLAAKNNSNEVAKTIIKFFNQNFDFVYRVFFPKKSASSQVEATADDSKPKVIRIFDSKKLTEV
jgi:hypothetical protein